MYPRQIFFGLLHAPPPANSPLNKPTTKNYKLNPTNQLQLKLKSSYRTPAKSEEK